MLQRLFFRAQNASVLGKCARFFYGRMSGNWRFPERFLQNCAARLLHHGSCARIPVVSLFSSLSGGLEKGYGADTGGTGEEYGEWVLVRIRAQREGMGSTSGIPLSASATVITSASVYPSVVSFFLLLLSSCGIPFPCHPSSSMHPLSLPCLQSSSHPFSHPAPWLSLCDNR